MLDMLGPIGAIQSPSGNLEFGNVGETNCVYFSYKGKAEFVPTVIYNPDELVDLIELVELAAVEIKTLTKGSIVRLGSMASKPITLRLALVHPQQQPPFLLLRLLQGNWSQDITCSPDALLQLLKTGQVDGPKPIVGRLERDGSRAWIIDGRKLKILKGLSPGRGRHGEYLHPDDVKDGEEVEAWPFTVEGKKFIAAFRLKEETECETDQHHGARADNYLARGHNHLARAEILELAKEQLGGGKVVAPWAAKASLTYLLAELADGNDKSAQQIWLGRAQNKFLKIGTDCMEAGQTSFRDILIYHQISAYFHSLNPDRRQAMEGVNHLMKTVCVGSARVSADFLGMALNNWYLYLKEVHEGEPPAQALEEWNRAVQESGLKPRPKSISFPSPDTWDIEEALISSEPSAKSTVKPAASDNAPQSSKRFLMVIAAALLVCLAMASSLDVPEAGEAGSTFKGEPALSISGLTLAQSWDQMDRTRDWEDRQITILSSFIDGGFLTVRFDADKNLKYIEGPELAVNGRPLFTTRSEIEDVLSRFGEPSQQKDHELTYVYEDAGQKCAVSMTFRERFGEYDPRTGIESTEPRPHLERVRLSLAGSRWKDTPSLPILSR